MPSIPSEVLTQWIRPGILVGVIALFLGAFRGLRSDLKSEIQASEARQEKQVSELRDALRASEVRQQQMDELKKDFRASEVRHSDALQASEARQQQMEELKKDFKDSEARQGKRMEELKKANEVLAGKMDQLLDAFRAAKAWRPRLLVRDPWGGRQWGPACKERTGASLSHPRLSHMLG